MLRLLGGLRRINGGLPIGEMFETYYGPRKAIRKGPCVRIEADFSGLRLMALCWVVLVFFGVL